MLEPVPDAPPADEDGHGFLQPLREAVTTATPTSIESKRAMPTWMVKATWIEDEAEASE
jgi:hypothetical protein